MNNFIKIDTAFNYTTGIIFPCENDISEDNSYIIITNRHLIDSLVIDTDFDNKNYSDYDKYFEFTIYDANGVLIPKEDIELYSLYNSESYDMNEDIMVFIIFIKNHKINVSRKISTDCSNDVEIFTEGYPSVLLNDNISNIIKLKGVLKTHELFSKGMNRYAVEDYHCYDKLPDLEIFSGLSGAPVKRSINEQEYIIGMNVSLPYQNNGENPFKLINFIKIKYILDYLREKGVIIYDILRNSDVRIKWIKKDNKNNAYNKTILVLGSSGAGKSSFIKSFALHNDRIDSSGDGQTTRCKVNYNYSLYQPFNVDIKLLNKDEFVEQRIQDIRFDLISLIFNQYYGLEEVDIYKDKLFYLKQLYLKIKNLSDDVTKNDNEKLNEIEKNLIHSIIPENNENNDDNIINNYNKLLEGISNLDEITQKGLSLYKSNGKTQDFLNILLHKEGLFNIKEFEFLFEKDIKTENQELKNGIGENKVQSIILCILENGEKINETVTEYIKSIIREIAEGDLNEDNNKVKKFYEEIYRQLTARLNKYLEDLGIDNGNGNGNQFRINELDICDNIKAKILNECLKVENENGKQKSLTSIIKEVNISDSISNEFTLLFNDMNINSIKFIDTRGLDHIEKGIEKEELLQKIFDEEKEKYEDEYEIKFEDGIDAVLYLKKLDSGKPTELSDIMPLIYKISPQISLYTVFTGVDIFYSNYKDTIIDLNDEKNMLPKSVEYIKSHHFETILKKYLKASYGRRDIVYKVLTKNIIAFCGNPDKKHLFQDSNKYNINKLLKSIIMRENMSIDYIKEDCIKNIESNKKMIESLIESLFRKATVADFGNTNAPATNFKYISGKKYSDDNYDFGYYGNYKNRLDLCFNNAYKEVFSQGNEKINELLNNISVNKDKIEAILINMKNKFLGKSKSLYKIWQEDIEEQKNEETEFISWVKKLYIMKSNIEKPDDFIFDPFNIKDNYYFSSFLDFLENKEVIYEENIENIKEKYIEKLEEEKKKFKNLIDDINKDGQINSRAVFELMRIIDRTYRRKFKTLKNDLDDINLRLANIIFERNYELTCSEMRKKLNRFVFNCSVYLKRCEDNSNKEVFMFSLEFDKDNKFRYFDQILKIEGNIIIKEKIRVLKNKYLEYCFNFEKRLQEHPDIKEKLVNLFVQTLKKEIENDKDECITNIINTNIDIRNSLKLTKRTIDDLFSFGKLSGNNMNKNAEKQIVESCEIYEEILKQCIEIICKKQVIKCKCDNKK